MASDTSRRKAAQPKAAFYRHPDGDRRHRHAGMTAEQGQKDKKARRECPGVPADLPPPTAPG
jgi:hypothetical protein